MFGNDSAVTFAGPLEATNEFFRKVYRWMTIGLLLTAVTAQAVASSQSIMSELFTSPGLMMVLIFAELGLVLFLSLGINRISVNTARAMFAVYSVLNGVTLSVILLVYTGESVFAAFLTTACMFGAMSVYGLYTKRDLTSMRSFLMMGLIGIIVAALINMFMRSSALDFVISIIGVLVFLGLTAYDTQKLRDFGARVLDGEAADKMAVIGALSLYLDFINLFLYMLRFMGKRR
ncbi:MAG: Bax inhibitor-1/YccA family protein [Synergistaceae bacterium]|jgi:FtsH-binding integral membrane protein|nr:Bax inhibitor-1/YccA family protein [Synergistaceae bacterium]